MPVKTVEAKLLLGWMSRDEALKVLLNECVFDDPLDEGSALKLWQEYRDKAVELDPKDCRAPALQKLTFAEKLATQKLVKGCRRRGATNVRGVVKVNPRGLIAHQLQIVLDRAKIYGAAMSTPRDRTRICLGVGMENTQPVPMKRNVDTTILQLPHAEFEIAVAPNGRIELREKARFVSVASFGDRMLLWAGYHRAYALASQTYPEETERSLLATLTTDADDFLGLRSELPEKRDMVRGVRPALLEDFFDDDLFMVVKLRKRRCEFHIHRITSRVEPVWVDDES